MKELHGPIKRACGHTTYRTGDIIMVTPEAEHWLAVQDCERCRKKPDWKPTAQQTAASKALRESKRRI